MTLRELRDALNKIIVTNEASGRSIRNNNPVIILLKQNGKNEPSKRYFSIHRLPDDFQYLGEGVPVEYREIYTIQVQEEDEIDGVDPWLRPADNP